MSQKAKFKVGEKIIVLLKHELAKDAIGLEDCCLYISDEDMLKYGVVIEAVQFQYDPCLSEFRNMPWYKLKNGNWWPEILLRKYSVIVLGGERDA